MKKNNHKEDKGAEKNDDVKNNDAAGARGVSDDNKADCDLSADKFLELEKKAAERDEYYKKWMLVHAEYENTRRRMEKESDSNRKFANESILSRLFPLVDNFDMAIEAIDKAEDKTAIINGIKIILKEFHKVLEDNGVVKIKTKGEMFDPHLHEAVLAVETSEVPEGTVVEEVRSGYTLNDRLLRPAQVKIAKSPDGGEGK
ncbi:MAG: nucleotide exchange factor GrpE [Candidatus Omnitrophica bacterium]|nr:nucleotide exchange factor GrpE [Candidatus Omnitrophota bacterium]